MDCNATVQTAAADVPRMDFASPPAASQCLLYEGQRTNLLLNSSNTLGTGWNKAGSVVITVVNAGAPDGTSTFNHWSRTTTSYSYTAQSIVKAATSLPYTLSCYAKAGTGGQYLALRLQGAYPSRIDACFDLQNGIVRTYGTAGSGFSGSASIQYMGNDIYRCILRAAGTDTAATLNSCYSFNSSASSQVDVTDSVSTTDGYIWGLQLEQAAAESSYIPTATTSVTRAADILSFTIPKSVRRLVYTFDDGTQQVADVSTGVYTVPTSLNRARIAGIKSV